MPIYFSLFHTLINYIFPFRCSVCTTLTESNNGICSLCWPKFNFISKPYCLVCAEKFHVNLGQDNVCGKCLSLTPVIDMTRSLFEFSSDIKKLIHKFKYNDKTSLGKFFASLLCKRFEEDFQDIDLIIPIPMHKFKRVFRGYNPPQILALELSKMLKKSINLELLIKTRLTENQVGLTKKQRSKNLIGSFNINKKFDVANKKILLVDDVLTTGATSIYCAKLLKKFGAKTVKLVTIAKVSLK